MLKIVKTLHGFGQSDHKHTYVGIYGIILMCFYSDKGKGVAMSCNFATVNAKNSKIMETTIEITRMSVFSQVSRRTEWQGTRSPQGNDYDRLALSDTDKSLFQSFFDEGAMHAVDICRPFLIRVSNTDESLSMTLRVTDDSDTAGLEKTMENMLTSHVLALWQEIVSPQSAAAAFVRRDDYALKLQSILYHHPAPARRLR